MRNETYREKNILTCFERAQRQRDEDHHQYGGRSGVIELRTQNADGRFQKDNFYIYIGVVMKKLRVEDPVMVISGKFKGKASTIENIVGDKVFVK